MRIDLRTATLEIILSLRVYDSEDNVIHRIVGIDTETKLARQCLTKEGKVLFKEIPFARFEFKAVQSISEADLFGALPPELHEYVVTNSAG